MFAGGAPRPLDGMRVLITAGGTREPLDAVRFVGNRSSGRMGFALAAEAARRGAKVTVIAANTALDSTPGVRYVEVQTAEELRDATLARLPDVDLLLMAAAVADFRPAHPEDAKISKEGRDVPLGRPRPDHGRAGGSRRAAPRGPDHRGLRRRARTRGRGARPREARAQGARRDRGERHLAPGHRLRLRPQRGRDPRSGGRAARAPQHQGGRGGPGPRLRAGAEGRRVQHARGREGADEPRAGPHLRTRPSRTPMRCSSAGSRCSRSATGHRRPCRSRRRSGSSPTRPRSARRSAARTSAAATTAAPRASSPPWWSAIPPTTTPTSVSAAPSRSSGTSRAASRHLSLAAGMRPDREDYRRYRDRLKAA